MLSGYRKEKDFESRERLLVMRNIMWAAMMADQKRGFKPTDIIAFEWEKNTVKSLTLEENAKLLSDIEKVKAFYEKADAKKNLA